MEEKELKTSAKQRVGIIAIAVVMLGSIIASYAAIVIGGGNSSSSSSNDESSISNEKMAQYQKEYSDKAAEFKTATENDYNKFIAYKSEISAYNETAANSNGVETRDLLEGDGRELADGDKDYLAYYVGWCADETIFDSSFDDIESPSAFNKALNASNGMIEGWNVGVVGMKLGGIRVITIPGELAYGENMEICGGYNKPLKFMIMAVANEEPLKTLSSELDLAFVKLQYAYYGVDYDKL